MASDNQGIYVRCRTEFLWRHPHNKSPPIKNLKGEKMLKLNAAILATAFLATSSLGALAADKSDKYGSPSEKDRTMSQEEPRNKPKATGQKDKDHSGHLTEKDRESLEEETPVQLRGNQDDK
jgi:hypothetical protein